MLGPKNNDLKSISDFNSEWADRIALLILVGLAIDILIVFITHGTLHDGLSILATTLIWLGVWGELWFAKRAREADDSRVAEANARAAEANQRAAEAQLALAQFRELRSAVLGRNIKRVIEAMLPFSGTICDFALEDETAEQASLWRSLKRALLEAEWACVGWRHAEKELLPGLFGGETSFLDGTDQWAGQAPASNLEIHIHPETRGQLEPAATALISVLNEIGIEAADMGFNAPNANPAAIHILVGEKR